jgi:hypothetical protein
MKRFQSSIARFALLMMFTAHSIFASVSYERMSTVRIAEQQTTCETTIAQRRKKRIIAATSTGIIAAASISWFVYSWLNPKGQPVNTPIDANEADARRKAAEADAMQHLAEDWKKQREFKGAVVAKMQDALAFGLASALISFVLSRGGNALNKALPILDSILPMSDIPLLITALRRAVVSSRHYQRTMLLLLEQPLRTGSLAHEIAEKTKRFEHRQLIIALEQLAAWLACFESDMGEIGYQEAQSTLGTLMEITSKLATIYEQGESSIASPNAEAQELIGTLRVQTEQLTSLIVPVLQELGYEQE